MLDKINLITGFEREFKMSEYLFQEFFINITFFSEYNYKFIDL